MDSFLRSAFVLIFSIVPAIFCPAPAFPVSPVLQKVEGEPFVLDLRYATENNFLKKNAYEAFGLNACWVHPDLFAALQKLIPRLKEQNLKLVLWDCYRPLAVQEAMWKLVPDARYVANPKSGSNHNRGVAVDVTLGDTQGQAIPMPTAFDDFTAQAAPAFSCPVAEREPCVNRDRLIELMKSVGLNPLSSEWWHFQLPQAGKYPIVKTLDASLP